MISDHHGRVTDIATSLLTATDGILGTQTLYPDKTVTCRSNDWGPSGSWLGGCEDSPADGPGGTVKKSDREIMEILEAFDVTGVAHSAGRTAGRAGLCRQIMRLRHLAGASKPA
jgi:hypothetical protein